MASADHGLRSETVEDEPELDDDDREAAQVMDKDYFNTGARRNPGDDNEDD